MKKLTTIMKKTTIIMLLIAMVGTNDNTPISDATPCGDVGYNITIS